MKRMTTAAAMLRARLPPSCDVTVDPLVVRAAYVRRTPAPRVRGRRTGVDRTASQCDGPPMDRRDPDPTGDERTLLTQTLDFHRATFL
jgi:hypothetical protein